MEHLQNAPSVLVHYVTLGACIDVTGISLHGASVATLLVNQSALEGSGKSQKKLAIYILARFLQKPILNESHMNHDFTSYGLLQWFKSQKGAKPIRLLPPPTSSTTNSNQTSNGQSQSSNSENLAELRVSFYGLKDSMVSFCMLEITFIVRNAIVEIIVLNLAGRMEKKN